MHIFLIIFITSMGYVLKTIFITYYLFLLCIFAFSCIFNNSTVNTEKFKSFVEVYPIEGNPIEVYPIEAYLRQKCRRSIRL